MENFSVAYEGKKIDIKEGITFKDFVKDYLNEDYHEIALCRLNEKYYELSKEINKSGEIELVRINSIVGMKIYSRTLQFIFIKAALDVFKDAKITIEHSISKALFGEVTNCYK